ncbi:hypothetical protein Kpol_1064p24 [Vanderwaltozyma polyspora DSM 70294]|uniref:Protoheme IX farnesyltransferase, mitochondrial n=1 Tax=Vanderwaltozyma polyspora (strain ATCC 22028 / DSM 70294 / BCRC 21397 / CBS 2163 / NBRC 10782 / NRRL Y-8283 / UCD 57-17) TaxID=436907 RepID=A7TME9_VANPO|nr:uncharacterized protein Kpol_1064p24 [Vanderwaltozyma polyspora DSM 70294]EDO16543.1 hypothetical protein Kpol_1064p24 [Vanderwaltozyma polyspora DSM 70294]
MFCNNISLQQQRLIVGKFGMSASRVLSCTSKVAINVHCSRGLKAKTCVNSQRLNTAPIEFTPNLVSNNVTDQDSQIMNKARKALRCTTDVTDDDSKAQMTAVPFDVKLVDPKTKLDRRIKRLEQSKSSNNNLKDIKKNIIQPYLQLTKPRLTMLVMLSAICSYALSPYSASISELMCLTIGTSLCSGAANAINMGREPDFDRQMVRTQARPVVSGVVTPIQSFKFATALGIAGVSILNIGVNPTVAILGASNIALYSWIYTSLKRKHIINTWVGALVGAIPPLMGWAAASPLTHPGSWCLAGLLYAWQFPHFNTLSHNIKNEYKNAGYIMTAWKNPLLNARVSLRYSLLMFPLCFGLSYFNVTDWYYQVDSGIFNAWMSFWAFKFYLQQRSNYSKEIFGDKTKFNKGIALANVYARKTFWVSIFHLPAVLILAILHKKGRWDSFFGNEESTNQKLKAT